MKKKKGGLGRGLDELRESGSEVALSITPIPEQPAAAPAEIPVDAISPSPFQPREHVDSQAMADLVSSVREHGVVEPILVRPVGDGRYEVVAGHRRLQAAQEAGLATIPAVVRRLSDEEALVLSLVENLQRADLAPLEEASAFRQLIGDFGFTHRQIGDAVGKSRAYITNSLRLMNLSPAARRALQDGKLSRGQALAIMAFPEEDRDAALARVLKEGLSVRQLEALAQELKPTAPGRRKRSRTALQVSDPHIQAVVNQLEAYLGTRVRVVAKQEVGRVEISFYSTEDLNRLLRLILPSENPY